MYQGQGGEMGYEGYLDNYTRGPWQARGTSVIAQVDGKPWEVCNNGDIGPEHPILGEALANASLIAAAPDLLAALMEAYHSTALQDADPSIVAQVRAAIEKATGR